MNSNYELLETFSKDDETWSYLRHKKTGLEIAYHKCETNETGFSFCFRTPVEDQYLGTSHVLEHCVFTGSKKYDLSFLILRELSCYSNSNAGTGAYRTRYYFYSTFEEECIKIIPILADYLFFPLLSEEAFMQECMRVEFDKNGDGRKKEIAGVVYNETKACRPGEHFENFTGGTDYLLHKLNVNRIREYHKKYYRPDNCLFTFNGNTPLDSVLSVLDKIADELEANSDFTKITTRKNLTVKEFLETVPFEQAPENLDDPEIAKWTFCDAEDICCKIEQYWIDGVTPLMPFVLEEKYAYTYYCWWKEHFKDYEDELMPPRIPVHKIISEYLSQFTPQEYKAKLAKLHEWQARDVRDQAIKIMQPLIVDEYDIELPDSKERKSRYGDYKKSHENYKNHHQDMKINIKQNSCSISFIASENYTREFFAEYALNIFLQRFLQTRLRQLGKTYDVVADFQFPYIFKIYTYHNNKPKATINLIKELIIETENYSFTKFDLLSIKSCIYSIITSSTDTLREISKEIFEVTPEELHQAAVRFSNAIEPPKHDETWYYSLGSMLQPRSF